MSDYLVINTFVDSLESFDDCGVFGDVQEDINFESVGIKVEQEEEEI